MAAAALCIFGSGAIGRQSYDGRLYIMTPFGLKMRAWRAEKRVTLQDQATFLNVSPAYLSALEHGKRGRIAPVIVDQICVWLGLIWDDAEELKQLALVSHPKPTIDTRDLSADATEAANILAQNIDRLSDEACAELAQWLRNHLQ